MPAGTLPPNQIGGYGFWTGFGSIAAPASFHSHREHITINSRDGGTEAKAREELHNVLADVRRGIWRPDAPAAAPEPVVDPTFHEFSSEWLAARENELRPNTLLDYRWQLTDHLLLFFANHRPSQISVRAADRYRRLKVREAQLSPNSINKTLTRLGQILEVALEYELVDVNSARVGGRRRRVRAVKPPQTYLDRAEQIVALLNAARELEAEARRDFKSGRPAFLSVLTFAGLRISEALAPRVRDVDLVAGRLRMIDSKTPTGVRYVDLLPIVREDLATRKATLPDTRPDALMSRRAPAGTRARTTPATASSSPRSGERTSASRRLD
jgi:integrase